MKLRKKYAWFKKKLWSLFSLRHLVPTYYRLTFIFSFFFVTFFILLARFSGRHDALCQRRLRSRDLIRIHILHIKRETKQTRNGNSSGTKKKKPTVTKN